MTTSNDALVADLFERLLADGQPEPVVDLVLAALEGWEALDQLVHGVPPARPQPTTDGGAAAPDPVEGVYLAGITATGFRGIGAAATVPLEPGPGLTVVVGANGSGKSSFAEALEVALLGSTHRFRSRVWREGWRNVHHDGPSSVEVAMHVPGRPGLTRLVRRWDGADFDDAACTVHPPAGPAFDPDELGWKAPLAALPPICASGEIEALLEREPSKLHDRLAAVLGLEQLDEAIDLLKERHADVKAALAQRDGLLRTAREAASTVSDQRAEQLGKLLRKRPPPLDDVEALVRGTSATDPKVAALETLTSLAPIDLATVGELARHLPGAQARFVELDTPENREASRTLDLLQRALDVHTHSAPDRCPVCGTQGVLDADWHDRTVALCEELSGRADRLAHTRQLLDQLLQTLAQVSQPPAITDPGIDGLDIAGLRAAWEAWHDSVAAAVATADADEVEHAALAVEDRRAEVVETAQRELVARQNAWLEVVGPVTDYVVAARAALPIEPVAERIKAASGWFDRTRREIRNERVAAVRTRARELWAKLRQQSSVELQDFKFEGTGNRRHVTFDVVVDGTAGQALGVMSQGELNALALSVFLPRATQPESPFRFVVVDDPIQAMDPAKVEGLAQVLDELAVERQVLVFTHDLRLVDAIGQLGIDATVLRVDRGRGSSVVVRPQSDAVSRLLEEARVLAGDPEVPVDVARLVSPNLCRQALETALARRYRRARHSAGDEPGAVDAALRDAKGLYELAALGLFEDATKHGQVLGRLNNRWGPGAADTFKALNQAGHIGLHSNDQVIDLVDAARKLIGQVAP